MGMNVILNKPVTWGQLGLACLFFLLLGASYPRNQVNLEQLAPLFTGPGIAYYDGETWRPAMLKGFDVNTSGLAAIIEPAKPIVQVPPSPLRPTNLYWVDYKGRREIAFYEGWLTELGVTYPWSILELSHSVSEDKITNPQPLPEEPAQP